MGGADNGEAYARAVLTLALGAEFTDVDQGTSGGPPGTVDGLFTLPSGRLGALEVTTIADQKAMATEGTAARIDWTSSTGARFGWEIDIESTAQIDLRRLQRILPAALRLAEHHDRTGLDLAGLDERWDPDLIWLRTVIRDVRRTGLGQPVRVRPCHVGAVWIPPGFDGLGDWINGLLASDLVAGKIAKLAQTRRDELHLFLRLHPTATTTNLGYLCAFTDLVPDARQSVESDLAGIWLASPWNVPLLRWDSQQWSRFATAVPALLEVGV